METGFWTVLFVAKLYHLCLCVCLFERSEAVPHSQAGGTDGLHQRRCPQVQYLEQVDHLRAYTLPRLANTGTPRNRDHFNSATTAFFSVLQISVYFIDSLVDGFSKYFNRHYQHDLGIDMESLSLQEQVDFIDHLYKVRGITLYV